MEPIIDARELDRIRRTTDLEPAIKDVLLNARVTWRGATLTELANVLLTNQAAIRQCLIAGGGFVHCPRCDRWFASRGIDAVVPKGTQHQLYHCPLAIPDQSLEGRLAMNRQPMYFASRRRALAISLQKAPLCYPLRRCDQSHLLRPQRLDKTSSSEIRLHDPTPTA